MKSLRPVFPIIVIVAACLAAFATILTFMPYDFNPDSAFYLLLAKEQLRSGSLFPPGMCYSTELFVLTPSLFMVPLMAFMKNWMLIRSIGICGVWAVLLSLVFKAFCIKEDTKPLSAAIAIALLCVPLYGSEVVDKLFLQGAYLTYCISLAAFVGIGHYLCVHQSQLEEACNKKGLNKELVLFLCGLFLLLVLPNLGGIRGILQGSIPFALALVLLHLVEGGTLDSFLGKRFNWVLMAVWVVSTLVAFVGYKTLSNLYWHSEEQMAMTMGTASEFVEGVSLYFANYLRLYGQSFSTPLVSLSGIMKTLNYGYAFLSIVALPLYGLLHLKTFGRFSRFVVLFVLTSNALLFFVSVATGSMSLASRYLIPSYFLNIFLDVVCVDEMLARRTKLERNLVTVCILCFALVSTCFFWKRTLPELKEDRTHQDIVAFLDEHDLDFGYATFFNSYVNTCFSDGDILVLSFAYSTSDESKDPTVVWRWLTNERWYDVDYHPGRCFILLRGDERIDDIWYERASETLTFEDYTVLVYDKNINLY